MQERMNASNKKLKRMNGMSLLVNDIKMVGVQKMTFNNWN